MGTAKFSGIKIQDTRMIRLMEVLLHGGTTVGGWTAKQIPLLESHLIARGGLGLTLVAHIAKAHGGRVELQSAPAVGSTFSILIPIKGKTILRFW